MNADEFNEMHARQDIPHDDELCWDAHDRCGSGYSEMRGPPWWIYLVVVAVIIAAVAYLLW